VGATLLWLSTTLLDALIVGALAWLVRRAERRHARRLAAEGRRLERMQRDVRTLLDDVERRARVLDHVLSMREATLRVLVETSAPPADGAATALLDAADVRLLRDLELSLERPAGAVAGGEGAPRAGGPDRAVESNP